MAINATDTYISPYAERIESLLSRAENRESYASPYAERINSLADALEGSRFAYDAGTDPTAVAMRKQYLNEAERSTADVLGKAAAATGGRPSSYAVTAAGQAANYYKSQLSAQQAELYDRAYDRYLQDYQRQLGLLGTLQGMDESAYGRYSDEYTALLQNLSALRGEDESAYTRWAADRQTQLAARDTARSNLVTAMATTGYWPTDAELAAAGMTRAEADAWRSYYTSNQNSGGGGYYRSSGGSGSGNSYAALLTGTQTPVNLAPQSGLVDSVNSYQGLVNRTITNPTGSSLITSPVTTAAKASTAAAKTTSTTTTAKKTVKNAGGNTRMTK